MRRLLFISICFAALTLPVAATQVVSGKGFSVVEFGAIGDGQTLNTHLD